jgi:5-methylcytosine-specific restriction endonuclease McrA
MVLEILKEETKQKITKLTGWHSHHMIWRSLGGSESQENLVLLHPNCHSQVHSRGISVEKPRTKRLKRLELCTGKSYARFLGGRALQGA